MSVVRSKQLHYVWQIVIDMGFEFMTAVLHCEGHQIAQDADFYVMFLYLSL